MNSNNVAQDLSAAALTKGIGLPGRHTCMTELRLTAAGNITLEMKDGATPFSQNFAKVCDLTLNADKHYSTGTAAPKAASADQWATNYYGDPLTWKSIAFE